MKKKHTYRTIAVENLDLGQLLEGLLGLVIVAIDIAKEAMVAGLADASGRTYALVHFSHPRQTPVFLELVGRVRELGREVVVAMEPTGAYSTALRHQLSERGVPVFRVDPKRSHDMAAVLDGVPSQHDAKSCTLIAYLHAHGISAPWRERSPTERVARMLVAEHELHARPEMAAYGHLEAITAASWPELNAMMEHRTGWYLPLLAAYPGPVAVASAPQAEVRALLRRASRSALSETRIDEVLRSAMATVGAPLEDVEQNFLRLLAVQILEHRSRASDVERRLRAFVAEHPSMRSVAEVVGPACSTALFSEIGDPAQYESAAALEKACGLNLRERSSGTKKGTLRITKRGPARVRQLLYLAAVRMIGERPEVRSWCEARLGYAPKRKKKAIVALMRKIIRALFHVARGAAFDANKLFDVRRLTPSAGGTVSSEVTSSAI
jgi:transposase